MHSLLRGAQWQGRRTRQLCAPPTEQEVPDWRLRSAQARRNVQVRAVHAHHPSSDVIEPVSPGVAPATAAASGAAVFSYLGRGSRNSVSVDDGIGADRATSTTAAAGEALLRQLRLAKERLEASLEQLFFDSVTEDMPGWSTTQMARVLMTLALLHRRPDDAWLNEFWSLTRARMYVCSTADLAMLSFGVSELQLRPPQEWIEALLVATLRLAETSPLPPSAAAVEEQSVTAVVPPSAVAAAAGTVTERHSLGTTLQLLLKKLTSSGSSGSSITTVAADSWRRQSRLSVWLPSSSISGAAEVPAGGGRRHARSLPAANGGELLPLNSPGAASSQADVMTTGVGLEVGSRGSTWASSQRQSGQAQPLPNSTISTSTSVSSGLAGASTSVRDGSGGAASQPRPINSAYDMENILGGLGAETSNSIPELVLESMQALWSGLRRTTAAVSAAWRRSRGGSELVTVVYNLTAVGMHLEAAWLARFLEVMRPRLGDLSGDDLHCLLVVAAEGAGSSSSSRGLVEAEMSSRNWQAALFARMDGINWALQGPHLVGCLGAISGLGLRPPPPWIRRQLCSLQPNLQFLPTTCLVELAGLLPLLPLYYEDELLPLAATAAVVTSTSNPPAATDASSLGAQSSDPWVSEDRVVWFERWLGEYRAAVSERCTTMEAADLLAIIAGVASVLAAVPPRPVVASSSLSSPSSGLCTPSHSPLPSAAEPAVAVGTLPSSQSRADVASLLLPRSGEVSYLEWWRAMVDAVAAQLPEASLAGLCEAWQVLAGATTGAQQQQQQLVTPGGGVSSDEAAGHLDGLRDLVASRLAGHHAQLSASNVAHVFSALAAAGLPLPVATLDALLTSAQPLLLDLTSSELVTVALSLLRLSYKPNLAWQAAFCAASRRRLGLMTPPQRCSLLVASASLGLHLPDPWVSEFLAVSERDMAKELDGTQLANLLWAVSCVASEPAASWLEQWEYASMPKLRELGPNMLAVVLKAMSTLHYRPSLAWQSAFFSALQRRLFAAGAAQLIWGGQEASDDYGVAAAAATTTTRAAQDERDYLSSYSSSSYSSPAGQDPAAFSPTATPSAQFTTRSGSESGSGFGSPAMMTRTASTTAAASSSGDGGGDGMLSEAVTAEALNSLVYSLASLDLSPPREWLDELADAIRCKLSLLSTLDLSVVLAYLVARSHRPNDDWWESFLEALESRFDSLSASEMSSLLVMLNALKVSPTAQWLDAFCSATQPRLVLFQPGHLLQVLSCMHLFRHRPGQAWMVTYSAAVEGHLPRFTPTELARVMMLLDNLNQMPTTAFMLRFYDFSRPGLAQLDTQELINVSWAVVSCSTLPPDTRWIESLVEAARPRLASLQQPQLRVLVAALGHMQRGAPCVAAEDFLAFAREFLVV